MIGTIGERLKKLETDPRTSATMERAEEILSQYGAGYNVAWNFFLNVEKLSWNEGDIERSLNFLVEKLERDCKSREQE